MKDQKCPIIIFCQAPADVAYVLTLYEKFKSQRSISIYVINVEGTYNHLKLLNLNIDSLQFIPYPDSYHLYRNPRKIIKARKEIIRLQKQFRQIEGHEVYYSSNKWDWLTFACIHVMRGNNDVLTYDYHNTTERNVKTSLTVKNVIIRLVLYYITRVKLQLDQRFDRSVPFFPYFLYGVKKYDIKLLPEIFEKYSYQLENLSARAILLYEHDMAEEQTFIKYEETISTIIKRLLKEGYRVYVKPHPRIGYSKFLDNYDVTMLPGFITGEFLPVDRFQAVLGIWTTSIAKISLVRREIKSISLLEMFTPIISRDMETMRDYLISQSEGHIQFAKSIEDLLKMLA